MPFDGIVDDALEGMADEVRDSKLVLPLVSFSVLSYDPVTSEDATNSHLAKEELQCVYGCTMKSKAMQQVYGSMVVSTPKSLTQGGQSWRAGCNHTMRAIFHRGTVELKVGIIITYSRSSMVKYLHTQQHNNTHNKKYK